jgi:hypothetical protein
MIEAWIEAEESASEGESASVPFDGVNRIESRGDVIRLTVTSPESLTRLFTCRCSTLTLAPVAQRRTAILLSSRGLVEGRSVSSTFTLVFVV